eukprot:g4610.t1
MWPLFLDKVTNDLVHSKQRGDEGGIAGAGEAICPSSTVGGEVEREVAEPQVKTTTKRTSAVPGVKQSADGAATDAGPHATFDIGLHTGAATDVANEVVQPGKNLHALEATSSTGETAPEAAAHGSEPRGDLVGSGVASADGRKLENGEDAPVARRDNLQGGEPLAARQDDSQNEVIIVQELAGGGGRKTRGGVIADVGGDPDWEQDEGGVGDDSSDTTDPADHDLDPWWDVPIAEVAPSPGHNVLRIGAVNAESAGPGSDQLAEILEFARWRRLGVVALSEFDYVRAAIEHAELFHKMSRRAAAAGENVIEDEGVDAPPGPRWMHHANYDLLWTNGAGLLIIDKELRRQVRALHVEGREAELKRAVRWRPRIISLYLDEVVLAAAYSPTRDQTAAAEEFDRGLLELMTEAKKRKQDKWKFRVCLGDFNAQVRAEEFGGMSVHGGGGVKKSTARGRKLARRLNEQNFVLAGSHFEAADGDYATFSSALGSSEVDRAIVPGGCLPKCVGYRRIGLNVSSPYDPTGATQWNSKRYSHKALELSVEVRTKGQLREEGLEKKLRGMQIATTLPKEVVEQINAGLQKGIEENRGKFGLEGFQEHLIKVLPSMLVPRSKVKVPKKLSKNPPRLSEDATCRAKMWQIFSESESLVGGKTSCAITAEQATKQCEAVGSNPLHPGAAHLPIESEMSGLVDPLPRELVEGLDAPIGFREFKGAVNRSWQGGRAVDVHGLSGDALRFFNDASLRLLLEEINKELEGKTLADLGESLHFCKDSALFKGKGDRRDPDGYRFLVISPVVLKLVVRIYSDRLYSLLEDASFFDASQFGFRRKRGCLESLLLCGRLKEDMLHQRCDELHSVTAVFIDLRKAFPSTDWRLMQSTINALGLGESRCWANIQASHRSATHCFPGGVPFRLPHGTKEGCVSSPLLFAMAYTPAVRLWRRRCEQAGLVDTSGLRLVADDSNWHMARRDRVADLLVRDAADQVHRIHDLLFADDTTILTQLSQKLAKEVTEEALRARAAKPKRAPMELPVMTLMRATLTDAGMRENETKREQGDVALLDVRNLGAYTDSGTDVRVKVGKAWGAFHRLKRLVSGVSKLSNTRKGELIIVMVRPILTYGLVARQLDEGEVRELAAVEMKMLATVLGVQPWQRWQGLVTDNEARRWAQIPPLLAHLKFLQSRFLSHTLRRERHELPRVALTGHFFPDPAVPGANVSTYLVSSTDNAQLEPKARRVPDVLASFHRHMADCGMPPEMLPFLSKPLSLLKQEHGAKKGEEEYSRNKRVMHALARKRFILDSVQDWSRGDEEEDQEAADRLTIRHFGDKRNERTRRALRSEAVEMGWDVGAIEMAYSGPSLGAEGFLRGDDCGICSARLRDGRGSSSDIRCDPVDELRASDELVMHLRTEHGLRVPDTSSVARVAMDAEAREKLKGWEQRFRDAALTRCGEAVSEVRQRGQPRVGRNAGAPLLRCEKCGINFSTTAGAMEKHQAAHGRDDYIWIYQVKGPQYRAADPEPDLKDKFRPEYHCYDSTNGRHHGGSDAVCVKVTPPADAVVRQQDGDIFVRCRQCKAVNRKIGQGGVMMELGHADLLGIRRVQNHEKACRRKPEGSAS